jgi:hypothetical protein
MQILQDFPGNHTDDLRIVNDETGLHTASLPNISLSPKDIKALGLTGFLAARVRWFICTATAEQT